MKTERMVLLVTPDEKARITDGASRLDVSASEYVRQLVNGVQPDDLAALAELEAFMPEFNAAVDSIHESLDRMIETLEQGERRRAAMDTPEYREQVRQELLNDPSIDWDAARRLFGREQAA